MLMMALPFGLHAAWLDPTFFGVLAFLSGALIAPTLTAHAVLVSRLAPVKYAAEAFTWSSTFIVSGLGAGMALGGLLVETTGLRSAFLSGELIVSAMSIVALQIAPPRAERPATAD